MSTSDYHRRGKAAAADMRERFPVGSRVIGCGPGWLSPPHGTVLGYTRYMVRVNWDSFTRRTDTVGVYATHIELELDAPTVVPVQPHDDNGRTLLL